MKPWLCTWLLCIQCNAIDAAVFPDCSKVATGVKVEQLLTVPDEERKWFANPAKSFEITQSQGEPAGWTNDPRKAWSISKSGHGYKHFYGEQGIYYEDMVEVGEGVVTLHGKIIDNTDHVMDKEIISPGPRGAYGTRNQRFATGRIEFSPDAFDMTATKRGAVMMEAAAPYNYGAWPAFWMMPSYQGMQNYSWAHASEVDILELWHGPQGLSTLMYNAVQSKTSSCGDAGLPPCEGKFTDSPLGPVGIGVDPWDSVCQGCKTKLPYSTQANSTHPDKFYGYGFEWDVTTDASGDITNAILQFTHLAEGASNGVSVSPVLAIKLERSGSGQDQKYSAQFRIGEDKAWTNADQMIGAWWKDPNRGVGPNYVWNVDFSLWQAWNLAYRGGMYMIINLAIGGDGHCCSQADLEKHQGIVMTNDLMNCTEGDSGWGKEFHEMLFHIRSVKYFNFDEAADYKNLESSAIAKCFEHSQAVIV